MRNIVILLCALLCGSITKAQSVSITEMNLDTATFLDNWVLNSDTFFVVPIFLDNYIDFNDFHFNIKYNHNVIDPILSDLDVVNSDNFILNTSPTVSFSMANGGNITTIVNTISVSQSMLSVSYSGTTASQTLYTSCNGNLMYLAFRKADPCFKGPIFLQFWNGNDNGTYVNPNQTHAFQLVGSNTYSTEIGDLLAVNGEILFSTPQANILLNGTTLDALVIGGTQPFAYEWSDKIGTIYSTASSYSPTDTGFVTLTVVDAEGCLSLSSYHVDFTISDIENDLINNASNIYPNPSAGIFFVKNPNHQKIIVFDMLGSVCYEGTASRIDLSKQQKGIYYVSVPNQPLLEKNILILK